MRTVVYKNVFGFKSKRLEYFTNCVAFSNLVSINNGLALRLVQKSVFRFNGLNDKETDASVKEQEWSFGNLSFHN